MSFAARRCHLLPLQIDNVFSTNFRALLAFVKIVTDRLNLKSDFPALEVEGPRRLYDLCKGPGCCPLRFDISESAGTKSETAITSSAFTWMNNADVYMN